MTRLLGAAALAALVGQALPPPAAAQAAGLTFEQVQRKYRKMSPVFIEKCDRDADDLYERTELQCVAGIYSAMYIER
jgi:hypothetical protein